MKELPILFNTAMVNAILEGRKTQTRRVMKPQPFHNWTLATVLQDGQAVFDEPHGYDVHYMKCPALPGDHLWVRETWRAEELEGGLDGIRYRADGEFRAIQNTRAASDKWMDAARTGDPWRPSIFMPRWASRITLEVTGVRAERVQSITEADAQHEGWDMSNLPEGHCYDCTHHARDWFSELWDSINAKRGYGWNLNPWVWMVEFKIDAITAAARLATQAYQEVLG